MVAAGEAPAGLGRGVAVGHGKRNSPGGAAPQSGADCLWAAIAVGAWQAVASGQAATDARLERIEKLLEHLSGKMEQRQRDTSPGPRAAQRRSVTGPDEAEAFTAAPPGLGVARLPSLRRTGSTTMDWYPVADAGSRGALSRRSFAVDAAASKSSPLIPVRRGSDSPVGEAMPRAAWEPLPGEPPKRTREPVIDGGASTSAASSSEPAPPPPRKRASSITSLPESTEASFLDILHARTSVMIRRAPSLAALTTMGDKRLSVVNEEVASYVEQTRSIRQRRHSYAQLVIDADTMLGDASSSMFISARSLRSIMTGKTSDMPTWLEKVPWLELVILNAINPFSKGWAVWTAMMGLLLNLAAYIIPFSIAFGNLCQLFRASWVFAVLQVIMYSVDMVLSSGLAYHNEDSDAEMFLVADRRRCMLRYLRTWFAPDMLALAAACVPLASCSTWTSSTFFIPTIFQALSLVKWVKLMESEQWGDLLSQLSSIVGPQAYRVVAMLHKASLLVHWFACFFHYVAVVSGETDTWLDFEGLLDASAIVRYGESVYWSVSTLTTVGYGDLVPGKMEERIFALFAMLTATTAFAYLLGTMASVASSLNYRRNKIVVEESKLDAFVKRHRLPKHLSKRLRVYYSYAMTHYMRREDQQIVNNLQGSLRQQVILYLHAAVISSIPAFGNRSSGLVARLVEALEMTMHAPGNIIMMEAEPSEEMHFVSSGELRVWVSAAVSSGNWPGGSPDAAQLMTFLKTLDQRTPAGSHIAPEPKFLQVGRLKVGNMFGQITCVNEEICVCSVSAASCSEIYTLPRRALLHMVVEAPMLALDMQDFVETVTDLPNAASSESPINPVTQLEWMAHENPAALSVLAKHLVHNHVHKVTEPINLDELHEDSPPPPSPSAMNRSARGRIRRPGGTFANLLQAIQPSGLSDPNSAIAVGESSKASRPGGLKKEQKRWTVGGAGDDLSAKGRRSSAEIGAHGKPCRAITRGQSLRFAVRTSDTGNAGGGGDVRLENG